jgi:hypothetical protein
MRANPRVTLKAVINFFAVAVFILLAEALIYVSADIMEINYSIFDIGFYRGYPKRIAFLLLRLLVYYLVGSVQMFIVRRTFIDYGDSDWIVERYGLAHLNRVFVPAVKCSLKMLCYKILVLSPITVGIYGISYFTSQSNMNELNLFALVCFMLSISFTLVWLGVCVHYFISLSLVKYINVLNPRANFFDACDLSVRLMDGKHFRVVTFYLTFLPVLLLLPLVYPLAVFFPFFMHCKLVIAEKIMGDYWQDKLLAMSRRWQKQQEREAHGSRGTR